jgi:hypothetical protein
MTSIRYLALASFLPLVGLAACRMGGDGMNMPPPGTTPTQTSGAPASEVDPNLHVTTPPSASGASTGMAPMGASSARMAPTGTGAAPRAMAMDAGTAMPNAGKKGGMAPMDAGAMSAMEGGMKPGCCGGPMPMPPAPAPPAQPMPMAPEHGGGHM